MTEQIGLESKTDTVLPQHDSTNQSSDYNPSLTRRDFLKAAAGGIAGGVIGAGAGGVVARLIMDSATKNEHVPPNSSKPVTTMPSPERSIDFGPATTEGELEQKYGINIYTQKEVFDQKLSPGFDGDPNREDKFDVEQIQLLDEFFSYLTPSFYQPRKGVGYGLVKMGPEFKYAGESYSDSGLIGLTPGGIDPKHPEGSFSLLVHESAHRFDFLTDGFLRGEVEEILRNNDYLSLPDFADAQKYDVDRLVRMLGVGGLEGDDTNGALGTLGSFAPGQSYVEGIAGLAQLYVKGRDRFLEALGPLLDGKGFLSREYQSFSGDLSSQFPTAQRLYDLYKGRVFDGKEYDGIQYKLRYGSPTDEDRKLASQTKEEIRNSMGVIIVDSQGPPLNGEEVTKLQLILKMFPKGFFHQLNGQGFTVVFTDQMASQRNDGQTVFLTRDRLSKAPYKAQLDAVGDVTHELIIRENELKGHEPEKKIIELLGGNDFLQDPERRLPWLFDILPPKYSGLEKIRERFFTSDGKLVPPEEFVALLGEYYVQGYYGGFTPLEHLFDPPDLIPQELNDKLNKWHLSENDNSSRAEYDEVMKEIKAIMDNSTTVRLYTLIGQEFFDGKEFLESHVDGIPDPPKISH